MAEDILNDSFPDLKELEIKTGRKIPESLLVWMRDAPDCEDGSGVVGKEENNSAFSRNLSDKINNLRQEMRWLRSVDVKILRQLVAVHEGIEAMRWLMEERGTLTSRGSSLTGSLSSLVTVEEHGPSMSPCRESPSPTYLEDLTEIAGEESLNRRLPDIYHSDSKQHISLPSSESSEGRPPSPSRSIHRSPDETSHGPAYSLTNSPPQDSTTPSLKDIRDGGNIIRKALLRSSRARGEHKVDTGKLYQGSREITAVLPQTKKNFPVSQTDTVEEEDSVSSKEKFLLGYDAQWRWVESQDDVTFL